MSPPILFLDVDGVLNKCGGQGLDSEKVALLKTILDATSARVVLSSTWRKQRENLRRVIQMLDGIGHELESVTPVEDKQTSGAWGPAIWTAPTRGQEIQAWLDAHPKETRFIILDDDPDLGSLLPLAVGTNSFEGLTPEIAQTCIQRLTASSASERTDLVVEPQAFED